MNSEHDRELDGTLPSSTAILYVMSVALEPGLLQHEDGVVLIRVGFVQERQHRVGRVVGEAVLALGPEFDETAPA